MPAILTAAFHGCTGACAEAEPVSQSAWGEVLGGIFGFSAEERAALQEAGAIIVVAEVKR